eukprot:TRINITY_DN18054_c0_g1_i1.p1 TRINITY_DN18054_c0_g1~~TRINITY_DN18054_c0_g1_i1.p1  ORF type:complete len:173 (+),score=35.57 TRINITY_DN18054_c0_g1_i1:60-521(+)
MSLPRRATWLALAAASVSDAVVLRGLPTSEEPCKAVMQETKAACSEVPFGSSNDACNYAVCYTADLNRDRCTDVETDRGHGKKFVEDLDKIKGDHEIDCDDGAQGGKGVRNARHDCGSVNPDGVYTPAFLLQFASKYPTSAETSGLKSCLTKL